MVAAVVSILMIGSGAAWWSLPLGQSSEQADKPVKASAPAMSVVEQTLRPAGARAESNSGRENIQIAAAAPEPEPSLPLSATKSLASSVVAPADANHADAVATEKKFMTAAAPLARPVSQQPAAAAEQHRAAGKQAFGQFLGRRRPGSARAAVREEQRLFAGEIVFRRDSANPARQC
jgi:hypothetical protein